MAAAKANKTTLLTDLDAQGSTVAWGNLRSSDAPIVVKKTPEELPEVLDIAAQHQCHYVVLDTPAHSSYKELQTLKHANFALIPCRASLPDLLAIGATIDLCQLAQVKVWVVLTAAPVRGKLVDQATAALKDYAVDVVPVVIHQRVAYVRAYAAGLSVLEYEPSGKAATEIIELYNWIEQKLGNNSLVNI